MSIDLTPLTDCCRQMSSMFYIEPHHFPRPLVTLFLLFGSENCKFSRVDNVHMLSLTQSEIKYSIQTDEDALVAIVRLADVALQALPLQRISDLLIERLVHKDGTLA